MDSTKLLHSCDKRFLLVLPFQKSMQRCLSCACMQILTALFHRPVSGLTFYFLDENSPIDNRIKASLMLSKLVHY